MSLTKTSIKLNFDAKWFVARMIDFFLLNDLITDSFMVLIAAYVDLITGEFKIQTNLGKLRVRFKFSVKIFLHSFSYFVLNKAALTEKSADISLI